VRVIIMMVRGKQLQLDAPDTLHAERECQLDENSCGNAGRTIHLGQKRPALEIGQVTSDLSQFLTRHSRSCRHVSKCQ